MKSLDEALAERDALLEVFRDFMAGHPTKWCQLDPSGAVEAVDGRLEPRGSLTLDGEVALSSTATQLLTDLALETNPAVLS